MISSTFDPLAGLILAGFTGRDADDEGVKSLVQLGVGGYILFGRNVESPEQVHRLLAGIRRSVGDRAVLYAVDQEGGRVARLRAPLTVWPPMARIGERNDVEEAQLVGQALASEIHALGFNLVFAPVLDVRFEGTTDAIGDRSIGTSPEQVGSLGVALAQGMQSAGLLACAKHFPGHGHVTVDSHLELPVCELSRDDLLRDHVAPFAAAADARVAAVMTAHVRYPDVDPENPATFSRTWLSDVLRDALGYSGLILSDDLEMGAVIGADTNDSDEDRAQRVAAACVRAIRAGVDGLLICKDLAAVKASIAALRSEADRDPAFLAQCIQSLARLEEAARLHPPRPIKIDALGQAIGTPEHQSLAERVQGVDVTSRPDPTHAHHRARGLDAPEALIDDSRES